jgi:hypothetical protein
MYNYKISEIKIICRVWGDVYSRHVVSYNPEYLLKCCLDGALLGVHSKF